MIPDPLGKSNRRPQRTRRQIHQELNPGVPSRRQQRPTPQGHNRWQLVKDKEDIWSKRGTQVTMLRAFPKTMLEGIRLATPMTTVGLISPFGLVAFGVQTSSQPQAVQSLVIRPKRSKRLSGSSQVNLPKSIEIQTVGNFLSYHEFPGPLQTQVHLSDIARMQTKGTKLVNDPPSSVHLETQRLDTLKSNGSWSIGG